AGVLCAGHAVRADVTYQYVTDTPTVAASSGAATVNVFLQETLTNNSSSLINPVAGTQNNGLFGAGLALTVTGGSGTISNLTLNQSAISSGGFGPNSATFDITKIETGGKTGGLLESVATGSTSGPLASQVSNDGKGNVVNRILLGTATISGVTAN